MEWGAVTVAKGECSMVRARYEEMNEREREFEMEGEGRGEGPDAPPPENLKCFPGKIYVHE